MIDPEKAPEPPQAPTDSLLVGVYPEVPGHEAEKREFLAWHKPRKQWIRKYQWLHEIGILLKGLKFRDDRPLKYLSLPGDDLLDIRVLHELCVREKLNLRYLGFSTKDPRKEGTQLNISIDEVSRLTYISKQSRIVNARLESVAQKNTLAHAAITDAGTFDVINIDLCDSIASKRQSAERREPTYYEGIHTLLDLQIKNRTEPWVLFLTTRTAPDDVYDEDARRLWDVVQTNMTANSDFLKQFESLLDHKVGAISRAPSQVLLLSKFKFLKFFGVGICKWILGNIFKATPAWAVSSGDVAYYRIGDSTEPEMLSICLHFNQIQTSLTDSANLVRPDAIEPPIKLPEERLLALQIISKQASASDVDQVIANDATLHERMILQSIDLLTSARYDCTGYREWASQPASPATPT